MIRLEIDFRERVATPLLPHLGLSTWTRQLAPSPRRERETRASRIGNVYANAQQRAVINRLIHEPERRQILSLWDLILMVETALLDTLCLLFPIQPNTQYIVHVTHVSVASPWIDQVMFFLFYQRLHLQNTSGLTQADFKGRRPSIAFLR
jgi:hypothetical protein